MFPNQNVNSDAKLLMFFSSIACILYIQDDFKTRNSILSRIVDLSIETDLVSRNVCWTIYTTVYAPRFNMNYVFLTWSLDVPFHGSSRTDEFLGLIVCCIFEICRYVTLIQLTPRFFSLVQKITLIYFICKFSTEKLPSF